MDRPFQRVERRRNGRRNWKEVQSSLQSCRAVEQFKEILPLVAERERMEMKSALEDICSIRRHTDLGLTT